MNLSLLSLSGYSIKSIFETAGIEAEVGFSDICIISKKTISTVSVNTDKNMISFYSHISMHHLNEKNIELIINELNNAIPLLRIEHDNYVNPDGSTDIMFSYDHILFNDNSISPINILNLHTIFEELVYQASYNFREAKLKSFKEYNNLNIYTDNYNEF